MTYDELLASKIVVAQRRGISIDPATLHPDSKPHQKDIAVWALDMGAGLIAGECGIGKTNIGIDVACAVLREAGKPGDKFLIVTELGAKDVFVGDDPEVSDGARMGVKMAYVKNQAEALASTCDIVVANYERVRMGEFDFSVFLGVWLDEGNYIKNMASNTTNELARQLAKVPFKWIATATPSPNEMLELINYAHVLGICDRGQILTRFFKRDSTKAGELTLHDHHKEDFWLWVSSWAVFISEPADLGYDNEGYQLPEMEIVWHEVSMDDVPASKADRDGVQRLYVESSDSLPDAARIKKMSIGVRIDKAFDIISEKPDEHYIIWHHLEDERAALAREMKTIGKDAQYCDIYGKLDMDLREQRVEDFTKGAFPILGTKPELNGVGCNFQKHCHIAIFLGITDSFDDWYQAIRRIWRYGQKNKVVIHCIYTAQEYNRMQNLLRKWEDHKELRSEMKKLVRKHGLTQSRAIEEKRRSFLTNRREAKGDMWTSVNNDCVLEYRTIEDNRFDMHLSSFPFGNHYEYTDKYNDFGHNNSNADFIKQLDYLIPELLRTLKPGRICAVHLKNRIHYGSVTGLGFSVMHRFTHLVCDAMEKHGFHTMGWHYIPTDVVAENNQTYRLTYGEMLKDSTKMGAGIPEEIWIFRKAPTGSDNAYADEPVKHNHAKCPHCNYQQLVGDMKPKGFMVQCKGCKQYMHPQEMEVPATEYTLADWQLDADAYWKSDGNRYLTPEELVSMSPKQLHKWWKQFDTTNRYDHAQHLAFVKLLDKHRKLSRTFTTLPLQSNTPFIWANVNRMQGLNLQQRLRKKQNHICPMPFDEVDRLIELYTNPGEEVSDPFGGLGTTAIRAVKKGRKAFTTELNDMYWDCGVGYLKEAEVLNNVPTLFDMAGA